MKNKVFLFSLILASNLIANTPEATEITQIASCKTVDCIKEVSNIINTEGIITDTFKYKSYTVVYTKEHTKLRTIKRNFPDAFNTYVLNLDKKDKEVIEEKKDEVIISKIQEQKEVKNKKSLYNLKNLEVVKNLEDYNFQKDCLKALEEEKKELTTNVNISNYTDEDFDKLRTKIKENQTMIETTTKNMDYLYKVYEDSRIELMNLEKEGN